MLLTPLGPLTGRGRFTRRDDARRSVRVDAHLYGLWAWRRNAGCGDCFFLRASVEQHGAVRAVEQQQEEQSGDAKRASGPLGLRMRHGRSGDGVDGSNGVGVRKRADEGAISGRAGSFDRVKAVGPL